MNDLIGVFDSGLGGVSVLHTLRQLMPNEHYLFYGDNANAPYGTQSLDAIRRHSERSIDRLLDCGVKAIVIACNTATSAYAQILRAKVSLPVIGMEPAIKPAQAARRGGVVPVLATAATLSLPKFHELMNLYGEGMVPIVGKGLVELIEAGRYCGEEAEETLRELLAPVQGAQIDALVLGCTHFTYLKPILSKLYPGIPTFDGRLGTARHLMHTLEQRSLRTDGVEGSIEFRSSGTGDEVERMRQMYRALHAIDAAQD